MSEDSASAQDRSEAPTARRRERARDEGQIPRSAEVSGATILLAGAVALAFGAAAPMVGLVRNLLGASISTYANGSLSPDGALQAMRLAVGGFLAALAPLLLSIVGVALLVNLAQTRGAFTTKPLAFQFSRVNPLSGLKRLFSVESLFSLLKGVLKFAAIALVAGLILTQHAAELTSLVFHGPADIAMVLRALSLKLAFVAGLAFLLVAGIDYVFQLMQHERRLRMTRQEIVQEHRESEGDPLLKSRILSFARALARRRMLGDVAKADVVITNPTHIAVALRYDVTLSGAPVVVAMGERKLAERIKKIAAAAGVTLVENKPVARALLATCQVGRPIAPALYAAIAEILAFVYRQRRQLGVLEAAIDAARRRT
ncbi:MAG: EscU/YscU/HrcU family type III secretion system export apparatus switch protein [Candidatus Eisenbacteria bacterium]